MVREYIVPKKDLEAMKDDSLESVDNTAEEFQTLCVQIAIAERLEALVDVVENLSGSVLRLKV